MNDYLHNNKAIRYLISHSNHDHPRDGRCSLEWVSYIAGERHSALPECVSGEVRNAGIWLNDVAGGCGKDRESLRPLLLRMIGTAGDGKYIERAIAINESRYNPTLPPGVAVFSREATAIRWQSLYDTLDRILPREVELPPKMLDRALAFCKAGS